MPTNEDRADRAQAALDAYIEHTGDSPDESHFRDLLTDLMHLAAREGAGDFGCPRERDMTFREALDCAFSCFGDEVDEEREEAPALSPADASRLAAFAEFVESGLEVAEEGLNASPTGAGLGIIRCDNSEADSENCPQGVFFVRVGLSEADLLRPGEFAPPSTGEESGE
jgi:hypothetical protein